MCHLLKLLVPGRMCLALCIHTRTHIYIDCWGLSSLFLPFPFLHFPPENAGDMSQLKERSTELIGDRKKDEHYWIKRAGARAQLYAAGYVKEDFEKPIITVAAP